MFGSRCALSRRKYRRSQARSREFLLLGVESIKIFLPLLGISNTVHQRDMRSSKELSRMSKVVKKGPGPSFICIGKLKLLEPAVWLICSF